MSVRAKMRVTQITEHAYGHEKTVAVDVVLTPVYSADKSDPNYSWSQATPTGEVKMLITNPEAFQQFRPGATYFVDFSPAD